MTAARKRGPSLIFPFPGHGPSYIPPRIEHHTYVAKNCYSPICFVKTERRTISTFRRTGRRKRGSARKHTGRRGTWQPCPGVSKPPQSSPRSFELDQLVLYIYLYVICILFLSSALQGLGKGKSARWNLDSWRGALSRTNASPGTLNSTVANISVERNNRGAQNRRSQQGVVECGLYRQAERCGSCGLLPPFDSADCSRAKCRAAKRVFFFHTLDSSQSQFDTLHSLLTTKQCAVGNSAPMP
jgi:hypothetical protein